MITGKLEIIRNKKGDLKTLLQSQNYHTLPIPIPSVVIINFEVYLLHLLKPQEGS